MTWAARAALLASFAGANLLAATSPTLDVLYPAGGARGSTNTITVSGKFDPWPPKIWVSAPGAAFHAETNKGKFTATIAADAEPGPRLVRLYNEEGVSETRFFIVGEGREIFETETNNHFASAQRIETLPVTINGRLEKSGDVDSFAIALRVGEELEAAVESHTLMSKLDGVLRLVTTNGFQLAWNHDFATFDPCLTWSATNEQTVVLQVYGFPYPANADVKLYGGESAFYRLHLATRGSSRGNEAPINHSLLATNSILLSGDDEHRFSFTAVKDQPLAIKVAAAVVGSPLDAWIEIEDANGKELARNDDAEGTRDPSLEWKAPAEGAYKVVVGSVTHRGGPEYHYGLTVETLKPDFRAMLAVNSLTVTAGSTNSLRFALKRLRGHTNELVAALIDLPEGITSASTNLDSKVTGDVTLSINVASNAPPFSGPLQLKLTDVVAQEDRIVTFPLVSRTEDNGVPGGYGTLALEHLDHVWLTVKPRPPEPAKETAKK